MGSCVAAFCDTLCPCFVSPYPGPFISYNDVKNTLKTGDLIIFRRRYDYGPCTTCTPLQVCCVECLVGSVFSHIGFVVRDSNRLYVAHAVMPKVRLQGLEYLIDPEFYSEVLVRPLRVPFDEATCNAIHKWALNYKLAETPYETSPVELLGSRCPCVLSCRRRSNRIQSQEASRLFCSQYVALMLQRHGRLSTSLPASAFLPQQFLEDRFADELFEKPRWLNLHSVVFDEPFGETLVLPLMHDVCIIPILPFFVIFSYCICLL